MTPDDQSTQASGADDGSSAATSTPTPSGLHGTAERTDATGDVAGPGGEPPPEPESGTDLVLVRLEADGETLRITFEAHDPIPPPADAEEGITWSALTWVEGEERYQLGATLTPDGWNAFAYDFHSKRQRSLQEEPRVDGDRLVLSYELSSLPRLSAPFAWSASSERGGKWRDTVPDAGGSSFPPPDDRATFPE